MKTLIAIAGCLITLSSARAQLQTLVTTQANTNSAVITVSSNSYAVVKTADYNDGGLLQLTIQGQTFTKDFSFESIENLTFAGPGTIQLQAHCCDFTPTYATVDVVHTRSGIQTLVTTPANTNS